MSLPSVFGFACLPLPDTKCFVRQFASIKSLLVVASLKQVIVSAIQPASWVEYQRRQTNERTNEWNTHHTTVKWPANHQPSQPMYVRTYGSIRIYTVDETAVTGSQGKWRYNVTAIQKWVQGWWIEVRAIWKCSVCKYSILSVEEEAPAILKLHKPVRLRANGNSNRNNFLTSVRIMGPLSKINGGLRVGVE